MYFEISMTVYLTLKRYEDHIEALDALDQQIVVRGT